MTPTFCSTALAERIERAEAGLITAGADAARRRGGEGFEVPVAGGAACFAGENSPFNKVVGVGFGGVPSAAELDEIETAFAARGSATQVELAHLADPDIAAALTARGYQLVSFENVLGRLLVGPLERITPPGVDVRPSDDDEFGTWLDTVVEGFANPDTQGVASHEEFPRDVLADATRDMAAAGATRYIAMADGVVAGAASVRLVDGIAQLTGAATAPAHRRRGVQTALLATRLVDAAAAGCDIAVVTTSPGSKSQENVQRRGFDLLYTRAILVKPAPEPTA
ncbi:GNAT family N-acetyltransferase [Mycobacterium sp. NPDC051804]|uniref:GNAT family N-acetyltransferase n=1 Tax=Mycobacterium sp. NPDC051804 TaxID=3364295 RepID=UPI0037AB2152